MRAQASLEYLFMLAGMFIIVLATLFAYNSGILPHTIVCHCECSAYK